MHAAATIAAPTKVHTGPAVDPLPALAITITPADAASAAILKLAAVHGMTVSVTAIETPGPGEPLRLELEATLAGEGGPVKLTLPELHAVLGAMRPVRRPTVAAELQAGGKALAQAMPAPFVDRREPVALLTTDGGLGDPTRAAPAASAPLPVARDADRPIEDVAFDALELHPADPDDVYRGPRPAPPAEPAQALPGLTALARITAKHPRLMPVATVLLRPLVLAGLTIEGDAEAMLAPMAEEFGDYDTSLLDCAARHILAGRHTRMPDRREIRAAIGVCAHPTRKTTKGD